MEEWRDIPGHEGRYQVSSLGRLKRIGPRRIATSRYTRPQAPGQERVWPGSIINGYYKVCLKRGTAALYVHRLVCAAFYGPAPEGKGQVAHGDGNKLNNRADNLRWASPHDNHDDMRRLGERPCGMNTVKAILTDDEVREIRRLHALGGQTCASIGARYGISGQHVSHIGNRKIWKHLD